MGRKLNDAKFFLIGDGEMADEVRKQVSKMRYGHNFHLLARLNDEEFLQAFEDCTLEEFHHADHVRMAWLYLRGMNPVQRK